MPQPAQVVGHSVRLMYPPEQHETQQQENQRDTEDAERLVAECDGRERNEERCGEARGASHHDVDAKNSPSRSGGDSRTIIERLLASITPRQALATTASARIARSLP